MKFAIGDKVRFMNENMEGIVSAIIDSYTVGVTVDHDFEIPVLLNELIKVSFDAHSNQAETSPPVIQKVAENGYDENMYASFVQKDEQQMELYFINHTQNRISVNYYTEKGTLVISKFFQLIEAFEYKSIDTLAIAELTNWPEFHFQILVKPGQTQVIPIIKSLQIPASRFFKHLHATPLLKKQGYLFLINESLNESDIRKLNERSPVNELTSEKSDRIKTPLEIIDLHIDKIHANYTQLTKQETLQIQLNYFEKNIDNAIATGMRKIVFIHGVGNLKLKNEMVKMLKQNKNIASLADAPTSQFGYGATEVFFSES